MVSKEEALGHAQAVAAHNAEVDAELDGLMGLNYN